MRYSIAALFVALLVAGCQVGTTGDAGLVERFNKASVRLDAAIEGYMGDDPSLPDAAPELIAAGQRRLDDLVAAQAAWSEIVDEVIEDEPEGIDLDKLRRFRDATSVWTERQSAFTAAVAKCQRQRLPDDCFEIEVARFMPTIESAARELLAARRDLSDDLGE